MNFLVIGCNGMAGHMISIYLKEQGYHVLGYARKISNYVETIVGDARNFERLGGVIAANHFDYIINCVGVLNQFAEENHADAVLVNSYLPHFLAQKTMETKTKIIQISTDCVFSGKQGGYSEKSLRDGTSFYDRTKAMGELEDDKNIIIRSSIIGPDINENGIGLLNWFMKQQKMVYGYRRVVWSGQTSLQLAKTIEMAVKKGAHGLYHMVPKQSINKYDLLMLLNHKIRKNLIEIIPKDELVIDKSLIRTNFKDFKYEVPDYDVMITELAEWMNHHKELYPQYGL